MSQHKSFAIIEHDPGSPPGLVLPWLSDAGYDVRVLRPHSGDAIPTSLDEYAGLILLGGKQSATSDEDFGWRRETMELLREARATEFPTLALCLSSQLVAHTFGGRVERGAEGLEVGAMLVGRKDVSYSDELFNVLPMAADVIEFHREAITALPPGAVHLMSGPVYENQAFRIGSKMWAAQFHIEADEQIFAGWIESSRRYLDHKGFNIDLLLERAAGIQDDMVEAWAPFMRRFAEIATEGGTPR